MEEGSCKHLVQEAEWGQFIDLAHSPVTFLLESAQKAMELPLLHFS